MQSEIDRLVAGWFAHYRLSTGSRAERVALERGEARSPVDEIWWTPGHPLAIDLLRALLAAATTETEFIAVAVGPLEDLLHEQGEAVIDAVEAVAHGDATLRRALAVATLPDRYDVRLRPLLC